MGRISENVSNAHSNCMVCSNAHALKIRVLFYYPILSLLPRTGWGDSQAGRGEPSGSAGGGRGCGGGGGGAWITREVALPPALIGSGNA